MVALDYQNDVRELLEPGEELLWVARPRRGIVWRRADYVLVPIGMIWTLIAVPFELRELGLTGGPLHPWRATYGMLFVAIGLCLMGGRLIFDADQRRRTWYGITSRRCIILRCSHKRQLNSIPLNEIRALTLQQHPDGSGTVLLDTGNIVSCDNPRDVREYGRPPDPCFDRIDDAPAVHELLTKVTSSSVAPVAVGTATPS